MFKQFIYQKKYLYLSIAFIACCVCYIVFEKPLLLALPFTLLLLPYLFSYSINFTENLFWLLIFCLPISTELNITPNLGLDFPDEILMLLITALVVIKLFYQPSLLPFNLLKNSVFFIVVLLFLWWMINCVYSTNTLLSVKFLLAKIWFIVPFVILPQLINFSISQFKKIVWCLLLPMSMVVILTLIRHAYYQFSLEGIKHSLSPFFRNHVNYSSMLVCMMAILWASKKLNYNNKNSLIKWINIGLVVGLFALIFAYSRGAWVALIAGIITIFIVKKKWILHTFIIGLTILIVGVTTLVYNNNYIKFAPDFEHTITHTNLTEHLQSTTNLKDLSNAERFYRWVAGANMFKEKPVVGFGTNTFYSKYKNYTSEIFKTYVSNNPEHSSVHNYFLLVALEQGFVGFALFCSLVFLLLMKTQYLYHQLQSNFYKIIALTISIITVMIICVNLMSDMIETDKIGSLFWLCVGFTILLENKLKEEKESIV